MSELVSGLLSASGTLSKQMPEIIIVKNIVHNFTNSFCQAKIHNYKERWKKQTFYRDIQVSRESYNIEKLEVIALTGNHFCASILPKSNFLDPATVKLEFLFNRG